MAVVEHHAEPAGALVGDKGLKRDAIGFLSNLVIGIASTAPAYSLAATLGFIVAVNGMGFHAPAVLLVSFVPILLIAFAYKYLNRADPDCGTTFAWGTRAMGPWVGWLNGWAIFVADVIVMASLSVIASTYTYLLFGWDHGANSTFWILIGATVWIAVMTWICWRGIELSARVQQFLLAAEILILAAFAIVALVKVYVNNPAHSVHPSFEWFNPFALGFSPLVDGMLLGIFIYWGWDSGVMVNEETESSAEAPGRAAVLSTLILLAIYLVVGASAQAYGGTQVLIDNSNDVLRVLGGSVFGSPWDKLLIIAVLTSASASTQTTILPTARTTLSMARWKAIPSVFGHIHPRNLTPDVSTLAMGGLSIVFTVLLVAFNSSQDVLGDSITAVGFAILFYYGFTGLICVVYFRKELVKSWKHFLAAGIIPFVGFGVMAAIFVKAFHDYSQTGAGYAAPLFGIQIPIVIGIGSLLLGVPLAILCAIKYREFFSRKLEVAEEGSLDYVPEEVPIHF
ncbi:MAG TPA: APC family permease [Gaiellaceae bacterium]|nr:APC family permease [Gaiellaceae bacterium]